MDFIRLWFIATLVFIASWFIWAFVPVLVPVIVVTLGLGVLVFGIVSAARALERWRGRARP